MMFERTVSGGVLRAVSKVHYGEEWCGSTNFRRGFVWTGPTKGEAGGYFYESIAMLTTSIAMLTTFKGCLAASRENARSLPRSRGCPFRDPAAILPRS